MTGDNNKAQRWRPQFSMRMLFIVATLVALYFGSWELTKQQGIGLVAPETRDADIGTSRPLPFDSSPAPFVVSRERYYAIPPKYGDCREYHLWFFGHTARLPFESEVE